MDQLVKRRAKSGLIKVNVDWNEAKEFITKHLGKEIKVRQVLEILQILNFKKFIEILETILEIIF